jgi:hypothetical protein
VADPVTFAALNCPLIAKFNTLDARTGVEPGASDLKIGAVRRGL